MKSNKVKLRGRLRKSLYWPMFMTILLICMNVVIYMDDILSGVMFSIFTAIYFVVSLIVYVRNKPVLVNELINFATQYGTVQRQLLNEFEIPYALLDYNAKILWVNEQFTELTGKDKKYHKSITTIFPSLTKEFLQKNEGSESVSLKLKDQDFRVSLKRIYFEELNSVDSLVTLDESNEYLTAIHESISTPILRKDFTVDPYMIYEAKVIGASAILLICAILTDEQLKSYYELATSLGLSVLVEAHDEKEVRRAIAIGADIIGVNNRDLKTFTVDIMNSVRLRTLIPDSINGKPVVYVSESGIRTPEDIDRLKGNGTDAVLIGETFMRSPDKKAAFAWLRGGKM